MALKQHFLLEEEKEKEQQFCSELKEQEALNFNEDNKNFQKSTNEEISSETCKSEFSSDYAALQQFKELIRITQTICEREMFSKEGISEALIPAVPEMGFLFDSNTFAEDLTKRANCT